MDKYTIPCTEEQTRKANELGAPIITFPNYEEYKGFPFVRCKNGNEYPCLIPTTEQMLGWLRSKGLRFKIAEYTNSTFWQYHIESSFKCGSELCYRDAVLSLIDAALDYIADNNLIK